LGKKNTSHAVFANVTIGLQLAITVLIFVFGGYRLDLHYDKSPLFIMIGTFVGMGLGFYNLIKELQSQQKREEERDRDSERKVRRKWM